MVSPVILKDSASSLFVWNVDAKVGANAPNIRDDVDLVQLGYFFAARNPTLKPLMTPAVQAAMDAVKPGSPCTGREDDPLVICIRAHEKARGGAQDGVVSPCTHGEFAYRDHGGEFRKLVVIANMNIGEMNPNVYPRVDKIAGCPTGAGRQGRHLLRSDFPQVAPPRRRRTVWRRGARLEPARVGATQRRSSKRRRPAAKLSNLAPNRSPDAA